jgi:hypothetical protein
MAALPLSASGHWRLQSQIAHVDRPPPGEGRKPTGRRTRNSRRRPGVATPWKKTQPKKTPFSNRPIPYTFRTAVTDGDRIGEAGKIAARGSALQEGRPDAEEAVLTQFGEGVDLPR